MTPPHNDGFVALDDLDDLDGLDLFGEGAAIAVHAPDAAATPQHEQARPEVARAAIAVVGLAGRFGPAADVEAFWQALLDGRELVRRFGRDELLAAGLPASVIDDPAYVPTRAALHDADCFDARHFAISPAEAALMDPQHRVFLEVAALALDDAAIDPARSDATIGVYAGCSPNTHLLNAVLPAGDAALRLGGMTTVIASDKDHLPTRVAYALGLRGPAMAVQTACSTGLVAVHVAAQALLAGDCDAAIAGAASIAVPTVAGHLHQRGGITSPDGRTCSFGADAAGTVSADAVVALVLRRLDDALRDGDPVRAVILGSAVTNDGAARMSYSAPGVEGQAKAVAKAIARAGVDAGTIGYIEGHGTATPLGDPVEVAALLRGLGDGAHQTPDATPCALGSVKSNLGHANAAAGAVGLAKAVLAVERGVIPASLHASPPAASLGLAGTRLHVPAQTTPWPASAAPRRAGVSSFGAGGTNAHVVLEQPPPRAPAGTRPGEAASAGPLALLLCGDDDEAIERQRQALLRHLERAPQLRAADVATTLQRGRRRRRRRALWWLQAGESAAARLAVQADVRGDAPRDGRGVAFVLPGQGFQQIGVGAAPYAHDAAFRAAFDAVALAAAPRLDGLDLREFLDRPDDEAAASALQARLDDQRCAGAFTLALSWSLAAMWRAQGVRPDALLGQSTGELAAAAIAGVLTIDDAVALMIERARLLQSVPPGAVLQVEQGADAVHPSLPDGCWVALRSGPEACVVSGRPEAIAALAARLQAEGVGHRRVRVDIAAHTPLLEPIAATLTRFAASIALRPPQIALYSGIDGSLLGPGRADDPGHWARLTIEPVDMVRACAALGAAGDHVLVELGPAGCMASPLRWNLPGRALVPSLPTSAELQAGLDLGRFFAARVAALAAHGAGVALPDGDGARISLPGTVFAATPHRIERTSGAAAAGPTLPALSFAADRATEAAPTTTTSGRRGAPRPSLPTPYRAPATEAERQVAALLGELLGIDGVGADDDFLALGGDSLISLRLLDALQRRHGVALPATAAFGGLTAATLAPELERARASAPTADASASAPETATPQQRSTILVPLRPSGRKRPVFFVHPAAGVVFPYIELCRQMDPERPFWGLQAAGLDGREPPDLTVEQMARRYLQALRAVQPEGPYHLAGFSFGCYVAYEMALQLHVAGEQVASLSLVDEAAPLPGHRPSPAMMARLIFGRAGRTLARHVGDYLALRDAGRKTGVATGKAGKRERTLDLLLQRSAMAALLPETAQGVVLDQPAMALLFDLLKIHLRETLGYTPAQSLPLRAVLFRSQWVDERPWWMAGDADPTYGWSKLARGGVEIVPLPGDHLAIIRQPAVRTLAVALDGVLDGADRRLG